MARSFVLGNGTILVDMDHNGEVRDFYYPYVGQENHVNGKVQRIGFWIDGSFSWFSSPAWVKKIRYNKNTLTTNIQAENNSLDLSILFNDIVVHDCNVFLRRCTIKNRSNKTRLLRIFFHQKFDIFESNIGDTVFYNPFINAIVHYKGKRYFLANGQFIQNDKVHLFNQYATGLTGEFGLEGTYVDAKDGTLSNNAIEHGSVDSTIGFDINLEGQQEQILHYWIAVGKNLGDVSHLNGYITKTGPEEFFDKTETYWHKWMTRTSFDFHGLDESIVELFRRSLTIVSCHVDRGGSIIASSDSSVLFLRRDTYTYMWPRDGALIARSLDRSGYPDITDPFFRFCLHALSPFGYLFHKFRPDGSWGSSWHPWIEEGHIQLPIQEDQIGLVVDALWKHYIQHGRPDYMKQVFKDFVQKTADFMLDFIDEKTGLIKESYDIWEEKLGIHTFTCCAVYAGLKAAGQFEALWGTQDRARSCEDRADTLKEKILEYLYDKEKGYFIKGFYYEKGELKKDMTIDMSSFYGVFQFHILPVYDKRVRSSYEVSKKTLECHTPVGGFARYEGDQYYRIECSGPGNPWFITTLWLAEYYIALGKSLEELQPAIDIFKWVASYSLDTGVLSEQLDPCSGLPLSVAPLTWSHAGFIIAVIKYLERLDELGICEICSPPGLERKKRKEKKG